MLICLKKFKHPCPIRYVELIPKFANNQKVFLVKNLPFVEEILFPNKKTDALKQSRQIVRSPTGNQLQAVRNLITGLTCDYEPSDLFNASYAKKKRYIKSKLLDTPYDDPGECTVDKNAMNEDVGKELEAVKNVFDFGSGTGGKRKTGPSKTTAKRGRK